MNQHQIEKLLPYMQAACNISKKTVVYPKYLKKHAVALADGSVSKECKELLPSAKIWPIGQALFIPKKYKKKFCREVRRALVYFIYAMIQHDNLPGAKRAELQKKGIREELTEVKKLAQKLEQRLLALDTIPLAQLMHALELNVIDAKPQGYPNTPLETLNSISIIKSAATLCTTPASQESHERLEGIIYTTVSNTALDNYIQGDEDEGDFHTNNQVLFRLAEDDDDQWKLLLVNSIKQHSPEQPSEKTDYERLGWLQARTPVKGTEGMKEQFTVQQPLVEFVYGLIEQCEHELQPLATELRSGLDRLKLVQRLDIIQEKFTHEVMTSLDDKKNITRRRGRDSNEAASLLLSLVYDFKLESGLPKTQLVNKLMLEVARQRGPLDRKNYNKPKKILYYTEMLTLHLGGRAS